MTNIGNSAFDGCTGLTSITIPSSVISIGYSAFEDCTSLNAITVEAANANYSSADGVVFDKNKTTLVVYPAGRSGTSYTIPSSVTRIENWAFSSAGITSASIPASVTSIGAYAFDGCKGLTSVTFETGSNVTSFEDGAFPEGASGSGGSTLKTAYQAADPHAGTYTRVAGGDTWTKSGS